MRPRAQLEARREDLRARLIGYNRRLAQGISWQERVAAGEARTHFRHELRLVNDAIVRQTVICDACGCEVPAHQPCPVCREGDQDQ